MSTDHYQRGVQLYQAGKLGPALECFRAHTQRQPADPNGFVAVGVILESQGKLEEAIEAYEVAVRLQGDAASHLKLAKTLSKLRWRGRADDEERHYRQAIALDPQNGSAWDELSNFQRERGQLENAVASSQAAIEIDPDEPLFHYRLALAYFFAGQDAACEAALRESNRLAIRRNDRQLDDRQADRTWFARPSSVQELMPEHFGQLYGRRQPQLLGKAEWPLPCLSYQQQAAYRVELTDVYLEGLHGLVYDDQRVYSGRHVQIQGVWRFFAEHRPKHPRETARLGQIASLHQPDCVNYYHWVLECLSRLLLLEPTLREEDDLRVLVPKAAANGVVAESLQRMGLATDRQVVNEADRRRRYHADRLVYVDWQWPLSAAPSAELAATWYPPRSALRELRRRLAGEPLPSPERQRVIYVRRAPGGPRGVKGDDKLIDRLRQELGERFVCFEHQGTGFADQIELFRTACLVFGPHGAGLTNLLFSAAGTRVVEFPVLPAVLNHYAHLSMALDHDYWMAAELTSLYHGSYRLDPAPARRLADQLIRLANERTDL